MTGKYATLHAITPTEKCDEHLRIFEKNILSKRVIVSWFPVSRLAVWVWNNLGWRQIYWQIQHLFRKTKQSILQYKTWGGYLHKAQSCFSQVFSSLDVSDSNCSKFTSVEQLLYGISRLILHVLDAGILHLHNTISNMEEFATFEGVVVATCQSAHKYITLGVWSDADVELVCSGIPSHLNQTALIRKATEENARWLSGWLVWFSTAASATALGVLGSVRRGRRVSSVGTKWPSDAVKRLLYWSKEFGGTDWTTSALSGGLLYRRYKINGTIKLMFSLIIW